MYDNVTSTVACDVGENQVVTFTSSHSSEYEYTPASCVLSQFMLSGGATGSESVSLSIAWVNTDRVINHFIDVNGTINGVYILYIIICPYSVNIYMKGECHLFHFQQYYMTVLSWLAVVQPVWVLAWSLGLTVAGVIRPTPTPVL